MSKRQTGLLSIVALATCAWQNAARADVVLYQIRDAQALVLPEGKAKMLPGRSISYRMPGIGKLTLHADTAQIIKAPTRSERFHRLLIRAKSHGKVEECLDAARFALQSGLIDEFQQAASLAFKTDRNHPAVRRMVAAKKAIEHPLGSANATIAQMKKITGRGTMKFVVSDHYVLMHDVSDRIVDRRRRTRAQQRLDLLEEVYDSYFFKFALEDKVLPPPQERLMVLLFGQEEDYLHYVNLLDPALRQASGFWSRKTNIAVFFDQGTTEHHRAVRAVADHYNKIKETARNRRVKGARDIVQFANTLDKLVEISREQADVSVVSHEATHQLAGNTGLFPRDKVALLWVHEGLATYFETPEGAGWGGIGAVNEDRLKWYNALRHDTEHSNIAFIVSDRIFDHAATHEAKVAAYGQAWALTHFLMETRSSQLMEYYAKLAALNIDEKEGILRDDLVTMFDKIFGNRSQLESQWRTYMRSLKTDTALLLQSQ
jgi:hypothetical protein